MPCTTMGWDVRYPDSSETRFENPDFRLFMICQDMLTFKSDSILPNELITIDKYYRDKDIDLKQVVAIVWNHGVADIWHREMPDSIQVVEFSPWQYNTVLQYISKRYEIQTATLKNNPNYIAVVPNRITKKHREDTYNDLKDNPLVNISLQQRGIELKHPGKTFEQYDYDNASNLISIGKNYADAWLAIVCESQYYEHRGIITEKTYNAIITQTPFLLVGSQYLWHHLQQHGFTWYKALGSDICDGLLNDSRRSDVLTYLPRNLRYAQEIYHILYNYVTANYYYFINGYPDKLLNMLHQQLKRLR
jgi:hypothetical protein